MLKTTIILFILTLIAYGICKLVGESMDAEEKMASVIWNAYPVRFVVSVIAFYVLLVAFAVCLIITVATW